MTFDLPETITLSSDALIGIGVVAYLLYGLATHIHSAKQVKVYNVSATSGYLAGDALMVFLMVFRTFTAVPLRILNSGFAVGRFVTATIATGAPKTRYLRPLTKWHWTAEELGYWSRS